MKFHKLKWYFLWFFKIRWYCKKQFDNVRWGIVIESNGVERFRTYNLLCNNANIIISLLYDIYGDVILYRCEQLEKSLERMERKINEKEKNL